MLLFGALRFAADRRGGKLGRGPDGSLLAQPWTPALGHQETFGKEAANRLFDARLGVMLTFTGLKS